MLAMADTVIDVLCRFEPVDSNPVSRLGRRRTELRFTVRRPASAEVSPCCHRPSGGDVACSVHVGVARARVAGDALENRLALAVFRRDMPALGASLRRIRCRDELNPPRGLVLQPNHQQSPPLAADLAVEAAFLRDAGARVLMSTARRAGHRPHLQVLDTNGVESSSQIGGGLFHPVTAAICYSGVHPRDSELGSRPPLRSASRPSKTLLQPAESLGFTHTETRSMQKLPVGQGSRNRNAAINTHRAAITGSRNRFGNARKSDVPASRAIKSDSIGLYGVGDVARPAELHPTNLGYLYLPIAAAEPLDVTRFDCDLPESFMRAGLAPGWATMSAVKKVAHRLGEVPQRLLLHGLRPGCKPVVFGAGRGQLSTLLGVCGRMATWLPVALLLDGKIPHKPSMATVLAQRGRLPKARKQPKPTHNNNNLGSTTDNQLKGGKRRFLHRPKPRFSTSQN
jgi:hypothetical protein